MMEQSGWYGLGKNFFSQTSGDSVYFLTYNGVSWIFLPALYPTKDFFVSASIFFCLARIFLLMKSVFRIYIYKKIYQKHIKSVGVTYLLPAILFFSYKLLVALHIRLYINKAIYQSNYGCRWSSLVLNHSKKILFDCLYQWRIQTLKYRKLLPPTHSSSAHSCIQIMILGGELAGDPRSQINFLGHSSLSLA